MKIIVGLGNPGLRYRSTKHNVGFMALDILAKKHRISIKKSGFQSKYAAGVICGEEVMLVKPYTYMNLSGDAVRSVCEMHLDDKENLLVVTDDFNIPLGTLRFRQKGSSGGHNGLRSIIEAIGQDFPRLRVGVGREDMPEDKAAYVLKAFKKSDKPLLAQIIDKASDCIEMWLEEKIGYCKNWSCVGDMPERDTP